MSSMRRIHGHVPAEIILGLVIAALLSHPAVAAKQQDDGIWRWNSAGAHVEIQDVVRVPNGKRLSDEATQRLFSKAATGSDYFVPGVRYVPFTVEGDICVLRFIVSYPGCMPRVTDPPRSGGGPFGLVCGQAKAYSSGVRVMPRGGRTLRDATAVVVVTSSRGARQLRWIGGSR